jgi:LmbE family N-acetylglucosaminyl deacetylase
MKKPALVCLFAHPDDESFGPSGTIHTFTKTHDVYIICATNGDAGENHHPEGDKIDLSTQRQSEIIASSQLLGVKKVYFLNHQDGSLCNNSYHALAAEAQAILDDLRPEIVLTYEHRGISGHIDHIVMSMITSFLYERLSYIKQAYFYCLCATQNSREPGDYFVFFPPGYDEAQIDCTCDVTHCRDIKIQAVKKHISQAKDMKHILSNMRNEECFIVWKK